MISKEFDLQSVSFASAFAGAMDKNLTIMQQVCNVQLSGRGQIVQVTGDEADVDVFMKSAARILELIKDTGYVDEQSILYCINLVKEGADDSITELQDGFLLISSHGKPIRPKTLGQKKFVESIEKNTITFGVGPAGTGKTYLSVVKAVAALKKHEISRIILTRPAVEAGEKLGFLPGDLQNKIDPYLRPLYDALFDTLGPESFQKNVEKGIIEVAPLAYMRGRTLDNAFIILDEAQNTSSEQMKMFLTRLGNGSKMVVNGDITQIDLPEGKKSGLIEALKILEGINDISVIRFTKKDIVRNKLVMDIVAAYDKLKPASNVRSKK